MNKLVKLFALLSIFGFLIVLGVQIASPTHTFVSIDDFTITVDEDISKTENITSKIFPIKYPAQFPDVNASNFNISITGNTQVAHIPFNVSGNTSLLLNLTLLNSGTQTFTLSVTQANNGSLTASKLITVTVNPTDGEAFFNQSTVNFQFAEDSASQIFDLGSIIDNDGESNSELNFSISQNQNELTCAVSGTNLTYTPKGNFTGTGTSAASCSVTLTDSNANISAANRTTASNPKQLVLNFNVTSVNDPVTLLGTAPTNFSFNENTNQSINLNQFFLDADTSDSVPQNLTFGGAVNSSKLSLIINQSTKTALVVPTIGASGNFSLTLNATDGAATATSLPVLLIVNEINNDIPVFNTSFFPITIAENSNSNLDLDDVVSDVDTDDSLLKFAVIGVSSNLNVTIDNSTHVMTISPKSNFDGNESFILTADDRVNTPVAQTINVVITGSNQGPSVPILTSPADGATVAVGSNLKINLTWNASADPENAAIVYNLTLHETANSSSNQTFSTANTFVNDVSVKNNINYTWFVSAIDNKNTTASSSQFKFMPTTNLAPVINSFSPDLSSKTIKENENISFTQSSSDPANDTLTFSWLVNGVQNTSTQNFTFLTGFNSSGSYNVTFVVSDGVNNVSKTVIATVEDLPRTISIKSKNPSNSDLILPPGGSKTFSIEVDNPTNLAFSRSWFQDGVLVSTGDTFTISAPASTGTNNVRVLVNSTESNVASAIFEWVVQTSSVPVSSSGKIKGTILNFSSAQLASVTGVTIENPGVAKIDFGSQAIDLTSVIDLDNFIKVEGNLVALDSAQFPALNKPATITLENVAYTSEPEIFFATEFTGDSSKVKTKCISCTVINATSAPTTSGTVIFKVPSFSTYAVGNAVSKEVANKLKFTRLKIAGDSLTIGENASSVAEDDIKPGDTVDIELRLENDFSSSSDPEISDIDVDVTIFDIDDGDELEFEEDDFDLNPGRSETIRFDFIVPDEVKDDRNYEVIATALGVDSTGRTYEAVTRGFIRIEKEKHRVHIKDLTVSPSLLTCSDRVSVSVDIVNRGKNDENNARVTIESPSLGINEKYSFELDKSPSSSDFDLERSFLFNVPSAAFGEHTITVNTYYGTNQLSETESRTITVSECPNVVAKTFSDGSSGSGSADLLIADGKTSLGLREGRIKGMSDEELLLIVLLGGVAVILVLLISIMLMMPKKKRVGKIANKSGRKQNGKSKAGKNKTEKKSDAKLK